jgi:hypothetical protein
MLMMRYSSHLMIMIAAAAAAAVPAVTRGRGSSMY